MFRFKKIQYIVGLAIIIASTLMPLKVLAVDYGFFAANDILFYDPSDCSSDSGTTDSGTANGSVVIIGDSLTVNDKNSGNLAKKMKDKGYNDVTIDAAVSRSLTQKGEGNTSGIGAVNANRDKILNAGTLVVALGTNSDASEIKKIPDLMKAVHDINGNISTFWVNTVNTSDPSRADGVNDGISRYATAQKYKIVDWHGAIYSNGAADSSLLDDSGYHQSNPKGINKHTQLIVDASGTPSSSGGSGGGAPMSGSTQDKNAAKVWNYLTGKGLTTQQAAGFLGNMEAESGINPGTQEYGTGIGYGLVQWSYERRTNLENFAKKQGKPVSDIDVQLDFLWKELTTDYNSTVLKPLKKTTTVREAAVLIMLKFEAPKNQGDDVKDDRTDRANHWFKKFSKFGTGSGVVSGTSCTCSTSGASDSGKTKILISPGHTGSNKTKMDGDPAIIDHIYGNTPELQDVWDVGQLVKDKLESKGYEVLMTKDSANSGTYQWNRAQQANTNDVALAFEIHTDSSTWQFGDGEVWSQFKDGYRRAGTSGNGEKVKLVASSDVISKSQEYAKKIAAARRAAGEPGVKSFNGTGIFGTRTAQSTSSDNPTPAGNIPLVMLWSKVPWVYFEAGASSSGLTDSQKKIYANGIVNGVVDSVPPTGGSSGSSGDCQPSSSGDASSIVEWALKMAWDDLKYNHGPYDAKPLYKTEQDKIYGNPAPGFTGYAACNAFVAVVMRASGADPKYGTGGVSAGYKGTQLEHIEKSKLYQKVENPKNTKNLQPGDILIMKDQHTGIYVGDQKGGNTRESSLNSHAPGAGTLDQFVDFSDFLVYRIK
jgi:N-acetylmuramoyl-L-alanine amidase